ncbi:nucleotide-diphospho-sugar transferase [Morchella snyderi]|nr:nucleotide-diphospho-sugar transferase [Morchella snyderi]
MQVKKAIEGRGKEVKEKDLCPPGPGFQAIILCGPGTSLYPFTGVEELLPKALIPIANKPMILYPLEWCQKGRFESILVLTLAEHLVAIQAYLKSQMFPFNIQVEAPSALDENLGTADVLRRAYREGWITGDIAVLPCDLITDLDPNELVKIWMVENAGFDCDMGKRNVDYANCREDDERRGGLGIWYDVRGEGQIKGQETDFLALAPHREPSLGSTPESQFPGVLKSLLFNLPGQEVMNKEERPFRKSLLRKFPNIQINQTVRDSGIYFLPFWVLRFIDKNSKMNSIREDVLPWWSKARWQNKRLAEKLGLLEILSDGGDTFEQRLNLAEMSSSRKRNVEKWTQQDVTAQRVYSSLDLEVLEKLKRGAAVSKKPAIPEFSTNIPSRPPPPPPPPPPGGTKIPPIIVYLPGSSGNFTRRVDTVHLYHSMCLFIASPAFKSNQIKINPSASIDRTATINRLDCLISAKVSIAGEAFIQRSVLGFGVSIGRGAMVIGSVLMDGASVAEGASVEGCILGKNVIIGADAKLKDCKVAPGLFVEPGSEFYIPTVSDFFQGR